MPLTHSPINGAPMRQIHRFGIEIDVCPTTGGIWLDKGELEKLIALVKENSEEESLHHRDRSIFGDEDGDDSLSRFGERGRRRSRLSDLFDF